GTRARIQADESLGLPHPALRRQARRAARRDVQPVQLGQLRLSRHERLGPGELRQDFGERRCAAGAAVCREVLFLATTINAELAEPAEKTSFVLRVLRFLR